jgi:hypothetical protein
MSFKTRLSWILAALLLTAAVALAAPGAPQAPQVPAVMAGEPLAVLSPAGPVCQGADLPLFSPEPQAKAETCGACSDAACVGKSPNAVCGSGLRCISGGPSCTSAPAFRCRCLII